MRWIIYIFLFAFIASGCSGSKRYYNYGAQLSEAGLHREAAERYMEALRRNRNNVQAQIALRQDGQTVLDEHLQNFYLAHTTGEHTKAVKEYELATRYRDMIRSYGIKLTFPDNYRPMFIESETIYLTNLYRRANRLIDEERYADAEELLKEITRLRDDFEDAADLKNLAFVEPRYQQALDAYDAEKFRKAYYLFAEVESRSPNYKDSRRLRGLAKEKALFTVGVVAFENKSDINSIESLVMARLLSEVHRIDDPFLRFIDRTNVERLLTEQRLSLEGAIDQRTAVMAGEMLGARALLQGIVLEATEIEGDNQMENRKGFLGVPVNVTDPKTGVTSTQMKYERVFYQHFTRENKVAITFQYQLVSTATGEILLSDVIELEAQDRAEFSRYEGDHRNLFPGTWQDQRRPSPNDRIYNSRRAKRELNNSLRASDEVESTSSLRSQVIHNLSTRVARELQNVNPES